MLAIEIKDRESSPAKFREVEDFWQCENPYRFRDGKTQFSMPGYCPSCGAGDVHVSDAWAQVHADGSKTPCWRETAICRCGMNTRMRATLDWLVAHEQVPRSGLIYCTEAITPFYRALIRSYPLTIGSEYVSRVEAGSADERGLRCENLERLSFPDASFDAIVSLDVLEHVFSFRAALSEMLRVLKPGGVCLITVPFLFDQSTTVRRAELVDGKVNHLLPPVYHGDPLSKDGALLVFDYGWDLLSTMRELGWTAPSFYYMLSLDKCYLGTNYLLRATRPPHSVAKS